MKNIILDKIKQFESEEANIMKKIKNLVIECLKDNTVSVENLVQNKEYHCWSTQPTSTIRLICKDEILKIERFEFTREEDDEELFSFCIYGKSGLLSYCFFTELSLKEELFECFKNNKLALDVIEYLYKYNRIEDIPHKNWEDCIKK